MTAAKGGQVESAPRKAGIIHANISKVSFEDDKLMKNAKALADAIKKAKPAGAKVCGIGQFDHGAGVRSIWELAAAAWGVTPSLAAGGSGPTEIRLSFGGNGPRDRRAGVRKCSRTCPDPA